jgi:general secretion pathway protein B
MSYILDALKRSDQDRKTGDVPNLHSQPDELVPASTVTFKRSRINLLLSLFLPMLAVLLVWVFSRSMIIDTSSPSTPVTATASNRNPSVDVSSMDENIAPQQEDISGDDVYLDELKDVRLDISPVDEVDVPVSQASTVEESAVHPPDPLVAATDERVVESEPPPEPPQSGSDVIERTTSNESSYGSNPYQGIPYQRQLPYDLQEALPDMDISVHMYSVKPSSRLVRINRMTYHEGDLIDVELKLEEITRDGLIMSIRDNRFWRYAR